MWFPATSASNRTDVGQPENTVGFQIYSLILTNCEQAGPISRHAYCCTLMRWVWARPSSIGELWAPFAPVLSREGLTQGVPHRRTQVGHCPSCRGNSRRWRTEYTGLHKPKLRSNK